MSFNEIVDTIDSFKELWDKNENGDNPLLRYQTRLIREAALKGRIEEFDPALMMAIVDHFTVHEDGRLQIRYHDGTEFEVATE